MSFRTNFRWSDYFMRRGTGFTRFWEEFLQHKRRDLLFILGHGFDERMCAGLEAVLSLGGPGRRDTIVIEYDEGPSSSSQEYRDLRERNGARLQDLVSGRGTICRRPIQVFGQQGRRIGARSINNAFQSASEFSAYSDVVVDVSALPRGLYFPLLAKLLLLFDRAQPPEGAPSLHTVVAHSPALDQDIVKDGVDESASYLHGFAAASFEREATRERARIWIPLLGKGKLVQLERIYELVSPDEICPLVPSPSRNPREADDLLLEYRQILFDQLRVERQNIIYASEDNPFEVYRQLMGSIQRYRQALEPLGGCKVVLSAMSSRLLSIGALLSAYELSPSSRDAARMDVAVAQVGSRGYRIESESEREVELYNLWLSGECYRRR